MRAVLTRQSVEWLDDHRIFFHPKHRTKIKAGEVLTYQDKAKVEPYVGFFFGRKVCSFGTMSFTNTEVPIQLTVGRHCLIGAEVIAHLAHHPIANVAMSAFNSGAEGLPTRAFLEDHGGAGFELANPGRPPPVIEHDVWIGTRAILMPGVVIRTGSVVAAGSVVTKSVGPYEIVGGNPARVIRKRFPDDVIAGLLDSEWWLYRFTDFAGLALDDPPRFLPEFLKRKPDLEPYLPTPALMADMPHD